jgi:hypothetical protein
MISMRRSLVLLPVLALAAQVQLFAQGMCVDKGNGFQFQPPKDWTQVPIQVEEKWIATKYLSDRKFDDKESGFSHSPLMRVIIFEKAATNPGGGETGSGGAEDKPVEVQPGDEISLTRPYTDYKDYLKRNFRDGGFYISAEKDTKFGETPVKMLEVKIEKLVRTGKKRIYCWIFTAEWGDLAIECEILEQFVDKLQPTVINAFKTFKLIARDPNAKKEAVGGGGAKIKIVDPNETPEMQKKRRVEMEEKMFKKAIADLPKEWTTKRTPHFLILNHAGVKYQDKVIAHAEAIRNWLDKEFGDIGPGYVQGCIIRICKDRDEERAFSSGSGDAWSSDSRELVTSESKDGLNPYEFQYLGRGLMSMFFHDKNDDLYNALPAWLETGLRQYIGTAVVKANQLQFEPDDSEKTRMREGWQKSKFKPVRDLVTVTTKEFMGEEGQYVICQCSSLVRYLMGPGRGNKKHASMIKGYLKNLLEVMKENEKAARAAVKAEGGAKTEEEEEEEFKKRRKQDWSAKEKEFLNAVMKAVFGDWTDADWNILHASWEKFAK